MKRLFALLLALLLVCSFLFSCTTNEEKMEQEEGIKELAEPNSYTYRFNGHWLSEKCDFSPLNPNWQTLSSLGKSVTISGSSSQILGEYGVCYKKEIADEFAFTFSVTLPCLGHFGVCLDGENGTLYVSIVCASTRIILNVYANDGNTILYKDFYADRGYVDFKTILDCNEENYLSVYLYSENTYLCGLQSKKLTEEEKNIIKGINAISFYADTSLSSNSNAVATFYDIGLNELGGNYFLDNATLLEKFETWAENEINGSKKTANNGITMFTPDGVGSYNALWTRDFAYMLFYGDTITVEQAIDCIEYLLEHAHAETCWIPDRVYADGTTSYAAGSFPYEKANLDNNSFIVLAMDYVLSQMEKSEAQVLFSTWHETMKTALGSLDLDDNGLIYNDPENPHSTYGFTDCICKTGSLMMESLLFWQASKAMAKWEKEFGFDYADTTRWIKNIEASFINTFKAENGMLYSATEDCHQIDIWGSCYAISIGFPMEESQKKSIADYLANNYDGIVQFGQVRHTEKGTYWQKLLSAVNLGEYQNGAYWATASGWLCDALAKYYPDLALITLQDLAYYFENYGIYECINGSYTKLNHYGASATNILQFAREFLQ